MRSPTAVLLLVIAVVASACGSNEGDDQVAADRTVAATTPFTIELPKPPCTTLGDAVASKLADTRLENSAIRPAVEALQTSGVAERWDAADVCVASTGRSAEQFQITVIEGTLSDELRTAAMDAAPAGTLTIEAYAWEGRPEPAEWTLAPDQELGPDTTTIIANVIETGCASGLTPEGRIPPPRVTYGDQTVDVAFTVVALPGPQTCQGIGGSIGEVDSEMDDIPYVGVAYTVTLSEPLGDRTITGMADQP